MGTKIEREDSLRIARDDGVTEVSIKIVNNEVESIVIGDLADGASRQEYHVFSNGDLAFLRSLNVIIRDVLALAGSHGVR